VPLANQPRPPTAQSWAVSWAVPCALTPSAPAALMGEPTENPCKSKVFRLPSDAR
jgi:hypothetical protein